MAPTRIPGVYEVAPDRLAAGPYPDGTVEELVTAGIRCFVDLTEDGADRGGEYARALPALADREGCEISYLHLGYDDMSVPTDDRMRAILDAIDDAIDDGLAVYVHCLMGLGRTGTVVGCWLARHSIATGADAIERIAALRGAAGLTPHASPVTFEQEAFVRRWPAGL
jgi:hypothetical protein